MTDRTYCARQSPYPRSDVRGSRLTSRANEFCPTECDEGISTEATPEQEHSRGFLSLQEREGLTELATSCFTIAGPAPEKAKMQALHRKGRIEVGRYVLVGDRRLPVAHAFL